MLTIKEIVSDKLDEPLRAPIPRRSAVIQTLTKNRVMVFGGYPMSDSTVWVYDLNLQQWVAGVNKGTPADTRHDAILVPADKPGINLFLLHGGASGGDSLDAELYAVFENGDNVFHWGRVETSGVSPCPRANHAFVLNPKEGVYYVYGGYSGWSLRRVYDDMYTYNHKLKRWSRVEYAAGDVPAARGGANLAYMHDNSFVVFGGFDPNAMPDTRGFMNDVHVFHCDTKKWTTPAVNGPKPPHQLTQHSKVIGESILYWGGIVQEGPPAYKWNGLNEIWILNTSKWQWGRLPASCILGAPEKYFTGRAQPGVVHTGPNDMLVFGGSMGAGRSSDSNALFHFKWSSWSRKHYDHLPPAARKVVMTIMLCCKPLPHQVVHHLLEYVDLTPHYIGYGVASGEGKSGGGGGLA